MPFSRNQLDDLQRAIRLALVSTQLNSWERGFLRDMQTKLTRYGPRTSLSNKQYRQLMKLTRKYATPKQTDSGRPKTQPFRPRSKRRTRSLEWRPLFGFALAVLTVGFTVAYKGTERFPEYLGPVVAISSSEEIIGPVTHVRDGDTIEVSGVPIRFGSLDCAESGTSDGNRATGKMRALTDGQIVTCYLNGRTSYDRKIGSCRLQDGRDLGGAMISEGYCRRFW